MSINVHDLPGYLDKGIYAKRLNWKIKKYTSFEELLKLFLEG